MVFISVNIVVNLLFFGIINWVQKVDKDHGLPPLKREIIYSPLIFLVCSVALYHKYQVSLEYFFYSYLTLFLAVTAYIDYQTKKVYRFMSYSTLVVGILYLFATSRSSTEIGMAFLQFLIFATLMLILGKLRMMGLGDSILLIAIFFFFVGLKPYLVLETAFYNIILANIIYIVLNRRKFIIKRFRFNETVPFVPSIALSSLSLIFFL